MRTLTRWSLGHKRLVVGRTGRLVTRAALILFLSFVAMATAPNTARVLRVAPTRSGAAEVEPAATTKVAA